MNFSLNIIIFLFGAIAITTLLTSILSLRWNILLRRMQKTRGITLIKGMNPVKLYSFMKTYTPQNESEKKLYKSACNTFKLTSVFMAISAIFLLILFNAKKVAE
ncbi:hypothetical protein [Halobacteriovorax marinus]|uniref:hypothetical protein n=1 Tax=Halobacteriovorax marinus TaxID=97084 RepID=UPI003A8F5F96